MNEHAFEVRFQYLPPGADRPQQEPYITDVPLDWPAGWPLPRVGEVLRHHCAASHRLNGKTLMVLGVHHDLARDAQRQRRCMGMTVTVTLGDLPKDSDSRLADIRD